MGKVIYILFICFLPLTVAGQSNPKGKEKIIISKTLEATEDETYLDSIKVDISKIYLDPDNIKEVRAFKGVEAKVYSHSGSVMLITRKTLTPLLDVQKIVDICKHESLKDIDANVNVIIDGNLIRELDGYKIEESTIVDLSILTKSKEGVQRDPSKPTIVIRTKNKP